MIWQPGFWKPGENKDTLHVVQKIEQGYTPT